MRVAPPTITTPFTSLQSSPASRSALRVGPRVFATRCRVISWNSLCVTATSTVSPLVSDAEMRASALDVRNSLATRDFVSRSRVSSAESGASFARSAIQQNSRWSKSSPPSVASPLVAITSNTPLESFRIEISKVPPPRS